MPQFEVAENFSIGRDRRTGLQQLQLCNCNLCSGYVTNQQETRPYRVLYRRFPVVGICG